MNRVSVIWIKTMNTTTMILTLFKIMTMKEWPKLEKNLENSIMMRNQIMDNIQLFGGIWLS